VNGTVVQTTAVTTATRDTLDLSRSGYGDQGDTITVEVTPDDGRINGLAAAVTAVVADSAPVIDSVDIDQVSPATADTLSVTIHSHDDDDDTVSYAYQWYRNSQIIDGATGATLTVSGNAKHGDVITVTVTPSDGTLGGTSRTSAGVTVQDTAPVVTAVTVTPSSPTTNQVLTARVAARDADNDTIT